MHLAPDARNLMINAQMAACKAVSLDESLGEAHASLGIVALRHGWDMPGAERALLRAITLNPGYATAYQWYGECLAAMGRAPESIEQLKKALDLDPFSPIINAVQAAVLYFAGRYDESIVQCRVTLQEIEDNFWPALQFLGLSYEALEKHAEAVRALEQAVSVSRGTPLILGALAHAHAVSGSRTRAGELLDALRHSFPQDASLQIALTAAGLGEFDLAFAELNRALQRRSPWLIFLHVDPRFGPLRSDSRFALVASQIGVA
jgi:tetratricopeptide (TPR) repeat protein